MRLTTHPSAEEFLRDAAPDLERSEAAHSLILGVALGLRSAAQAPEAPPLLVTVRDATGLAAAALMTPPHPLVLAGERVDRDAALEAVLHALRNSGRRPSAVVAPTPVARRFAERWAEGGGDPARLAMRQRLHALGAVYPVPLPPGRLRPAAGEADAERVAGWMAAFDAEALAEGEPGASEQAARRRVAAGEFVFWDDGGPRAMAARARPTRNTISVNGVYTPPEWRGRGYATALVARLSEHLLGSGFAQCVLFTDLANSTSNSIYARIGYRPVLDFALYRFGASA